MPTDVIVDRHFLYPKMKGENYANKNERACFAL